MLTIAQAANTGGSDSGSVLFLLVFLAFWAALYWTPTIVAVLRRDRLNGIAPIVVVNFFLGWTFIGWVVALVMASKTVPAPVTVINENYASAAPTASVMIPGSAA